LSLDRAAAALLIALPIAFNGFFFLLGRLFDYRPCSGTRWATSSAASTPAGCG